jgi:hypothetical protein
VYSNHLDHCDDNTLQTVIPVPFEVTSKIPFLTNILIKVAGCLCGLEATVPGYRPIDPGSIPAATTFSEK